MIITDLIKQDWKKNFRSQTIYRSLAIRILLGLMALYFVGIFLVFGLFLSDMLEGTSDVLTPLELVNSVSLYIILTGILIRVMMQSLKNIDMQVYQSLPIKRKTLVNFIMIRPIFGIMNYFVLIVFIPFAIKGVMTYYSLATTLQFILVWILIIWFDLLLASYLKRRFGSSFLSLIVGLLIIGGLFLLEHYHIFSLTTFSKSIFDFLIIQNPFGWLFVLTLVALVYLLNYSFFSNHYYLEEIMEKSSEKKNRVSSELTFLERFGIIGEIIRNLMRLIFRHKRTRSLFYMSIIFLLYGFIFYNDAYQNSPAMMFFCAIILTGMAMMMFGQWVYSWESSYFDALMTKSISIRDYVRANYFFLLALAVASFVLTTPYFFLGSKIVFMHIAAMFYNVGISIPILLYFGTFNTKRIDLNNKSAFNYQGTTYKSFLMIIPIMIIPIILIWFLGLFMEVTTALIVITGLGLVSMIFTKPILNLCVDQLKSSKYAMAEGFREKE